MAEEQETSQDDDVGYCKPPKHAQFKKGQSGNPSGKRKRQETFQEKLRRFAGEKVVVHQNGAPVTMTRDEAMLTSVFMKAMKGNLGSAKFVAEHLGSGPEVGIVPQFEVTEADLAVLETEADWRGLLERSRAEVDAGNHEQEPGEEDEDDEYSQDF